MSTTDSSYPVYLGTWTNWSHGKIFGSTLTLSKSNGALLVAFTAFFITIVGTQLWRILCFILHGYFSRHTPQDALYNQRQALLRNSASPIGGIWVLIQMIHAWSHQSIGNRPFKRLFPILVLTFLIAIGLAVASGLSSRIAFGNEVLIDGTHCGFADLPGDIRTRLFVEAPHQGRAIERAADYAQRCYESDSTTSDCNILLQESLPITSVTNASCPFDSKLCISQDSNIMLESGLLDSAMNLGLNWPNDERFQLQFRMHCAPLVTEGYRSDYHYGNKTYVRYQYGDGSLPGSGCDCTFAISNNTLEIQAEANNTPFLEATSEYALA